MPVRSVAHRHFFSKQKEKGKIAGTVRLCYNDRDFSTES